ncbi:MAG: redoxin family protein [Caldisericia bacterium]|nr:redoxin family protein [Caldisericia bacterium]
MEKKKEIKKKESGLKTYFIISGAIIVAFVILISIFSFFNREIPLDKALKEIFGKDYKVLESKSYTLPDDPNFALSIDTVVNSKGTIVGKYSLLTIKDLSLKNIDNSIKVVVCFDDNGKISKIKPLSKIKTEKETNWNEFFSKFIGKDYKDLLSTAIPLPAENGELATTFKDKLVKSSAISYINQFGVEAYTSLKTNQTENETKRLLIGDKIPSFEATDINGEKISSELIKGRKTVIVSTNATCGSCIEKTHAFDELIYKVGKNKNFNYILISETAKDKTINEYLTKTKNKNMKIIIDTSQELLRKLTIEFTPDVLLVDIDGTVVYHNFPNSQDIEQKLTEFLK